MTEVVYKKLSYQLVGCLYAVRNKYNRFHKEKVYHNCLEEELTLKRVGYSSKPKIPIYSMTTGKKITYYEPDLLVDNKIIVELKALPFTKQDELKQLGEYIKTTIYEVGYLVNFGELNFKPLRFIYTNDRKSFINQISTN